MVNAGKTWARRTVLIHLLPVLTRRCFSCFCTTQINVFIDSLIFVNEVSVSSISCSSSCFASWSVCSSPTETKGVALVRCNWPDLLAIFSLTCHLLVLPCNFCNLITHLAKFMLHLINILLQLTAFILGLLHAVGQLFDEDADIVFLPKRSPSVRPKQLLLSLLSRPFLQTN